MSETKPLCVIPDDSQVPAWANAQHISLIPMCGGRGAVDGRFVCNWDEVNSNVDANCPFVKPVADRLGRT